MNVQHAKPAVCAIRNTRLATMITQSISRAHNIWNPIHQVTKLPTYDSDTMSQKNPPHRLHKTNSMTFASSRTKLPSCKNPLCEEIQCAAPHCCLHSAGRSPCWPSPPAAPLVFCSKEESKNVKRYILELDNASKCYSFLRDKVYIPSYHNHLHFPHPLHLHLHHLLLHHPHHHL